MQKFLVKNSNTIKNIFWTVYILLIVVVLIIFNIEKYYPNYYNIGRLFGNLAITSLIITLAPGILNRYNLSNYFKVLISPISLFKRQFGLLVFFLAFSHYLLLKIFPTIKIFDGQFAISTFEIFGMNAFIILVLLAVTSNNYFVQKLKKNWGKLHKLVHIAIWFIAIHIIMINPNSIKNIIFVLFAIIDLGSFAYEYRLRIKKTKI
jgi:DMSO/TMAO reductase YedYZ heme-binding membrane subunit